jgi:uncharacterized protein YjiS (DUF1127 family)
MTTLDRTSYPMTGFQRPALAVRATTAVANAWKTFKNRREIHRLGELSDIHLRDIGLTRADLHVVWRMPLGNDPTAELGQFAEARAAADIREVGERAARQVC